MSGDREMSRAIANSAMSSSGWSSQNTTAWAGSPPIREV
jgi:hypothetical protein